MNQPKGKLIAIGGAEDKGTDLEAGIIQRNRLNFFELGILKRIMNEAGGEDARIEVVTTASSIPQEVGQNYLDAFGKLGHRNIGHMNIRNREDALKPELLERVKHCRVLMFSGGNQLRLTAVFGGTEFLQLLLHRYEHENFIVAGTSAGAMAMSRTMIYQGNAGIAHLKGEVKITTGLGLVDNVIIDSHFDKRGRFSRLAQAVTANPSAIGIGLGEDTGVFISNGHEMEIIGSGAVTIVDGKFIRNTNIAEIEEGKAVSVENLVVHILEKGNRFDTNTRKVHTNNYQEQEA